MELLIKHMIMGLLSLSILGCDKAPVEEDAYWIWAGIPIVEDYSHKQLYLYQGRFYLDSGKPTYERRGLYPHSIEATSVFLVFRLDHLVPVKKLLTVVESISTHWTEKGVNVEGIQLDFDSPTARLLGYSDYLKNVRSMLSNKLKLSITGLGDWLLASKPGYLEQLADEVDEIVFQLYQGREELDGLSVYLNALKKVSFPYKLGVLQSTNKTELEKMQKGRHFRGVIYFVQL